MSLSIAAVGRRVEPYRLQMGSPVGASRPCGTSALAWPVSPCSGEKIAASRTPGAPARRSIARRPRGVDAGLVGHEADRVARQRREVLATSTSSPVRTGLGGGAMAGFGAGPSAAGPTPSARSAGDGRLEQGRPHRRREPHAEIADPGRAAPVGVDAVGQDDEVTPVADRSRSRCP